MLKLICNRHLALHWVTKKDSSMPANTSLVLDSLCNNIDTHVPATHRALQQVSPKKKVVILLFCSALAVQCCHKTRLHCKENTKTWLLHWNKSKQSSILSISYLICYNHVHWPVRLCSETSSSSVLQKKSQFTTTVTKAPSCDLEVDSAVERLNASTPFNSLCCTIIKV